MMTTESELGRIAEPVFDEATLDRLMAKIDADGLELLGPDGVLTELTSRLMNRAMQVELTDSLGYEAGDPAGRGSGNNRNGTSPKRVLTDAGAVPVKVPRDRNGEFEPKLVPRSALRRQTQLGSTRHHHSTLKREAPVNFEEVGLRPAAGMRPMVSEGGLEPPRDFSH